MRLRDLFVIACCFSVATLSVARADEASLRREFDAANRAASTAKTPEEFRQVAGRFETLRDSGGECGAVLYDLGNAYFRAGEYGRAIAAYLEAQRYSPRDPTLAANLAEARRAAGQSAPEGALVDRLLFWRAWLSYPESARIALGVALLAFALGVFSRRGARGLVVASRVATVLAALATIVFVLEYYRHDVSRRAVVAVKEVTARMGDSESYAEAFTAPLTMGQELTVLDVRNGFVRIALASGIDGWVPESSVVVF